MNSNLHINIAIPKFFAAHCRSQLHLLAHMTLFCFLFAAITQPAFADGGLSPFGQQVSPPGIVSYTMVPGISTGSLSDIQSDYGRSSGQNNTLGQQMETPDAQLAPKGEQAAPSNYTQTTETFCPRIPSQYKRPQTTTSFQNGNSGFSADMAGLGLSESAGGVPETFTGKMFAKAIGIETYEAAKNSPKNAISKATTFAEMAFIEGSRTAANAITGDDEGGGEEDGGEDGGGGGSGGGGGTVAAAINAIMGMPTPMFINIANTQAQSGIGMSLMPFKTIQMAVGMVQAMYKTFFIPLGILLLLPGAVMTQVKAQVTASFNLKADDATSPFEGILRAMVAVFLIPATQLIVSYSIDVGNSLAYSVTPMVSVMPILAWLKEMAYSAPSSNSANALAQPTNGGLVGEDQNSGAGAADGGEGAGGGAMNAALGAAGQMGQGAAAGEPDDEEVPEEESAQSTTLQTMFNALMFMFSTGLLIMTAFQLVIMCYLYLLGPVAAAFYAWPSVQGKLFRSVFGNWVNAVITVSLWRFYWMVILVIMVTRLSTLGERGSMLLNLQWEMAVMTCLIGLMFYIPMNPWNFNPGQAFRTAKFYGESIMEAAKGGGGQGGGGGGGGGGQQSAGQGSGGGQDTASSSSPSAAKAGGPSSQPSASPTGPPSSSPTGSPAAPSSDNGPPAGEPSQSDLKAALEPPKYASASPSGGNDQSQPANTGFSMASAGQPANSSPYANGSGNPPTTTSGQGTGNQPSTPAQPYIQTAATDSGAAGQNNGSTDNSRGAPPVPLLPESVASNSPPPSNAGMNNSNSSPPPNNTESNTITNPDRIMSV